MNIADCRICQSQKQNILFKKFNFDIVKCLKCGLVYTDLNPDQKFFDSFYSKNYFENGGNKRSYDNYQGEEKALLATFRQRINLLNLKEQGSALDIGCAYGYFIKVLPRLWSRSGVEVSTHASKFARKQNPTATIVNGELTKSTFKQNHFNLVTLWDVVEHLPKPLETITIAHSLLKKGGTIALTTGDVDSLFARLQGSSWHLYNPPQHLSYFSTKTIKALLKKSGFRKIKVTHPSASYPLSYLLHKLRNLYHLPLPNISWADQIIIRVNLKDIMLATAVK